jgi:hypothetical protein
MTEENVKKGYAYTPIFDETGSFKKDFKNIKSEFPSWRENIGQVMTDIIKLNKNQTNKYEMLVKYIRFMLINNIHCIR